MYFIFFVVLCFTVLVTLFQFPDIIHFEGEQDYLETADLSEERKSLIRGLSYGIVISLWFTLLFKLLVLLTGRCLYFSLYVLCCPCALTLYLVELCSRS